MIRDNLEGKKFGKVIVLSERKLVEKCNRIAWLCECECGNKKFIPAYKLKYSEKSGTIISCGCVSNRSPKLKVEGTKIYNLNGQRFGKLVVTDDWKIVGKQQHTYWRCLCDCGNEIWTRGSQLTYFKNKGKDCSCGCVKIKYVGEDEGCNIIFAQYKQRAINVYKKEFTISFDLFKKLIKYPCVYCGSPPTNKYIPKTKTKTSEILYSGLDRIDSSIGYTDDNVVPCCSMCNRAKSDTNIDDFKKWITLVYTNLIS